MIYHRALVSWVRLSWQELKQHKPHQLAFARSCLSGLGYIILLGMYVCYATRIHIAAQATCEVLKIKGDLSAQRGGEKNPSPVPECMNAIDHFRHVFTIIHISCLGIEYLKRESGISQRELNTFFLCSYTAYTQKCINNVKMSSFLQIFSRTVE